MSTTALPEFADSLEPGAITAEWDRDLTAGDPLGFAGYARERDRCVGEAVVTGRGAVGGVPCAIIESNFDTFGGSMGLVVGERVSRAFRRAADQRLPVVASVRTGGARMQEGMLSLIQMPRVVAAVNRHSASGLLSAGCLRSPSAGGVLASWVSLLDLRVAEPGAMIGFAGPRVVAEMTGALPPSTSHTAESALRAGLVDEVAPPVAMDLWLRAALGGADLPLVLPSGRSTVREGGANPALDLLARARGRRRPSGLEWAAALCDSWVEVRGSDPTFRAGLSMIAGQRCVVIAMDRHVYGDGKARPGPEAYRLAQRAIRLAGKLSLPVLTLIDTPGAEPGPASEAGGIAREIAETLRCLDELATTSVSVCVGEGGSGGAIALAHTDRLLMLTDSIFSVIGPEAAAVILWRDRRRVDEATEALRIDSAGLLELGIADAILPEPTGAIEFEETRRRIVDALTNATAGERMSRIDHASSRWLDEKQTPGSSQSSAVDNRWAHGR